MKPTLRLLPFVLPAALSAQRAAEFKPAPVPDAVKGVHDMSAITPAERAMLQPKRALHASGPVVDAILAERATLRAPVLFDGPGDGRLWALATTYKASFGAEGFTYVPFLGSHAPRNYPVQFVLRAVRVGGRDLAFAAGVPAARAGTRVVFDRGAVQEVYDLAPENVEQTFVVDGGLAGDVEVELEVVSDLQEDGDRAGLQFGNALGRVEYGAAFLVDGDRKEAVATEYRGRTIRLRVDAAQRGAGPVVIDPIISTSATSWTLARDAANPDIAYDATTDRYLVVQEHLFSATDSDVVTELRDRNGAFVAGSQGVIDATPAQTQFPRVANLNAADRFLVVTQRFNPHGAPGQQYTIFGRTVDAAAPFAVSLEFQVSEPLSVGDKFSPDVGGDPNPNGPTYWTVVYTRVFRDTDWDIHGRQVDATGTARPNTIFIENSANSIYASPQISQGNGNGSATAARWLVVYSFRFNANDWDVYGASIDANGGLARTNGPIDTSTELDLYPQVSSPSLDWTNSNPVFMVTYERQAGFDLMAAVVSAQLVRIVVPKNLSTLFGFGGFWGRVESDGCRFVVTHGHVAGGSNPLQVATLAVHDNFAGGELLLHDAQTIAHTSPPNTPIAASSPMLVSKRAGGGLANDYGIVFLNHDAPPARVNVSTYQGRTPGTPFTTRPTGCGGLSISVSGRPFLGETVRFPLANFGGDLFGELLGTPGPTLPLCSAGCGFGLDLAGPVVNFPNNRLLTLVLPCRLELVGAQLAVQGYALGSGSCLGLLRFTDTVDFTIR